MLRFIVRNILSDHFRFITFRFLFTKASFDGIRFSNKTFFIDQYVKCE